MPLLSEPELARAAQTHAKLLALRKQIADLRGQLAWLERYTSTNLSLSANGSIHIPRSVCITALHDKIAANERTIRQLGYTP